VTAVSIQQFQRKLNLSRRIHLAGDNAELRVAECEPGITEPHAVEHIEELAPELQVHAAVTQEAIVLYQSYIEVVRSLVANIRQSAARIAEGVRGRLAEYARAEPCPSLACASPDRNALYPLLFGREFPPNEFVRLVAVVKNSGVPLSAVYMPFTSQPDTSALRALELFQNFFPFPNGKDVVYATTSRWGLSKALSERSSRRLLAFWKLLGVPLCSSQPTTASVSPIPLLTV
jgi:hypothetical protein